MTTFELSHLDQNSILFFIFSAIGLIRERKVLPFVIVILSAILHGALVAVVVAALVVWHRLDSAVPEGIQFKDFFGFFLLFIGALAPAPVHEFSIFFGVAMISLSFGKGMLGTIPALVLYRQYFPEADGVEVVLAGAGVYWITAEIMRWTKSIHEAKVLPVLEGLCSLMILSGFHTDFPKWFDDSSLLVMAAAIVFFGVSIFSWIHWKNESFVRFDRAFRSSLLRVLTVGQKVFTDREPFAAAIPEEVEPTLENAFDRIFYAVLAVLAVVAVFVLVGRGGFGT